MGIFDALRNWLAGGRIKNLEARLRGRPMPQDYIDLFTEYKKTGNIVRALQILKMGASRYPDAPEINRRLLEAEKVERENEKHRLQERIQTHPNPILYARLAELYKADNETDRAMQICLNGTKAFPRYGGTYLVLGQIYAEREKWEDAMIQLSKAVELDKYNYMALKLLAQVYMQVRRPADAVRRLEEILYFAPGDEAILELLKKAREAAGAARAVAEAAAPPTRSPTSSGTAISTRKTGVFQSGTLQRRQTLIKPRVEAPAPKPEAGVKDRALSEGLAKLREVEHVYGVLLVDQFGLVIASSLDESLDEGLAGALVTNVYRATSTNAMKLGVGTFEEGLLEGEEGNIHLVQVGETICAVFAKPQVKVGLLEKTLREVALTVIQR